MTYSRQIFNISTDTGVALTAKGDTGPPTNGEIVQIRWNPTSVDTGADLMLMLLPKMGDTGDGWLFFNDNDCMGVDFVRAPRQPQHGSDGAPDPSDTGAAFGVPIVAAGDRIRVKVLPGQNLCVGRLYVWIKS